MEQQDKERLFVLLGDSILSVINLTALIIALAYDFDLPAVYISYIVSLLCLTLSCTLVSTAGGKSSILNMGKILLWVGMLGLAAAGVLIMLRIFGN